MGNRGNRVAESAKSLEMMVDRPLYGFGISGLAELGESCPFAQDVPNDLADSVGEGPDGLNVSKTDH